MIPTRHVLIVEDEQTLRAAMVRGLSRLPGVVAEGVGTVEGAKRALRVSPPSLVISDLDLPDGSGVEVIAALEAHKLRVPVVFVSGYIRRYKNRIPNLPSVELHEKPLSMAKLREIVEDKLGLIDEDSPSSPFGVTDFVQLAGMGRHTVVIEVRAISGEGQVIIKGGELWNASDPRGEGLEAFRRLVFLRAAQVTCRTLGRDEVPARNIDGSAEAILLDVARGFDETEHASGNLGSLDDRWEGLEEPAPVSPKRPQLRPRAGTTQPPPMQASPTAPAPKNVRLSKSAYPPPLRPTTPTLPSLDFVPMTFDEAFERGVDSLLTKDYKAAYAAFCEAERVSAGDRRVRANLERLRAMGFS